MYSKREVQDAKQAMLILRRIGLPGMREFIRLINTGGIVNCPVTAHDVYRANRIYGPVIASLKGKSKLKSPEVVKVEHIPRPVISELTLHVDIMVVEGIYFLVSVSMPLGLTMCNYLMNKSIQIVRKAMLQQIAMYRAEAFTVSTIRSDNEGAVMAVTEDLNYMGIKVDPAGPGQHVPVVENKIKQIKERVRAFITTLPYQLPHSLLKWLVLFAVSRINMMPSAAKTGYSVSPIELFKGRKIDYKRDVRIGFGEYVQADDPNVNPRNSLQSRTNGAIALLPTGNLQGSVKFYSLATGGVITRDHFKIIPMPDEVIAHMNTLAEKDKQYKRDVVVQYGSNMLEVQENQQEDEDEEVENIENFEDPPTRTEPTGVAENIDLDPDLEREFQGEVVQADQSTTTVDQQPQDAEKENEIISPSITPEIASLETAEKRYNTREAKKRKDDLYYHYGFVITVKKGIQLYGENAKDAIKVELKQLHDKQSWMPLTQEQLKKLQSNKSANKIIRSHMVLKEKFDSRGEFEKLKARVVAGGNEQDRTVYANTEIASYTVDITSVFMVLIIAVKQKRNVVVVDIVGAYLNAKIKSRIILMSIDKVLAQFLIEIHPEIYQDYLQPDGTLVVQLLRALYGCVESAKLWFDHLTSTLKDYGFEANPLDPCVMNKEGKHGKQMTVCIYVDDLLITSEDNEEIEELLLYLNNVYKNITKKTEKVISYLGMTIDLSSEGKAVVTMEAYINDILKSYNVNGKASTPATSQLFVINENSPALDNDKKDIFHSRVAKLLYLAKRVRPDILTAVVYLSTRVSCPNEQDWEKLERILKYLNAFPEYGMTLIPGEISKIEAYIDASFACHHDRKSHSGIIIMLGGCTIFCRSVKQRLVVKSSAEAELVAVGDECTRVIWCREFLKYQGISCLSPSIIFQDNKSAIAMMEKGYHTSSRSKHIEVKYFFIKNRIERGEIIITYLPSSIMISDTLTKALQGELFRKMCMWLLGETTGNQEKAKRIHKENNSRAGEC
jgi:hypothetical protein